MSQPLSHRRGDWFFVVCFAVFLAVVLVSDIASVMVPNLLDLETLRRSPPLWPPWPVVEGLAAYGAYCDLLVLHNPPFFVAIMWGDVLFLGPYYAFAIYAFARGRDWIRIPTFIYASHALSYALVLTYTQLSGPLASPRPALVLAAYAPFWIVPLLACWRVRHPQPFSPPHNPVAY